MIKLITAYLLCVLSISAFAQNIGFTSGDSFTANEYSGTFTLFCPSQTRSVYCRGYGLDPAEFDYLTFPASIDADKVELTRTSSRGETRSKDSKIRSGETRSKKRFNLWIRTLFQRPLLAMGINNIRYEFSKNSREVTTGNFTVEVKEGTLYTCNHDVMSGSDNDCQSPMNLCDSYFRRQNYCRN